MLRWISKWHHEMISFCNKKTHICWNKTHICCSVFRVRWCKFSIWWQYKFVAKFVMQCIHKCSKCPSSIIFASCKWGFCAKMFAIQRYWGSFHSCVRSRTGVNAESRRVKMRFAGVIFRNKCVIDSGLAYLHSLTFGLQYLGGNEIAIVGAQQAAWHSRRKK